MKNFLGLCGVYMIRCVSTGEYYIGGTLTQFAQRFAQHIHTLKAGQNPSPKMQIAYNEHGVETFEFIPLYACPPEQVHERECEAIETLRPAFNSPKHYAGLSTLSRQTGINYVTLKSRMQRGLTGDDLITPPHKGPRKQYVRKG